MKKYNKDLLSAVYKNQQINLIILATKESIANCKVLETGEKILLKLSSYELFQIAPGEIATIGIKKIWEFGDSKYILNFFLFRRSISGDSLRQSSDCCCQICG